MKKKTKTTRLEQGRRVEMEHTDDPEVARTIAKGHLNESKDYYAKLKIAEDNRLPTLKRLLKGECRARK